MAARAASQPKATCVKCNKTVYQGVDHNGVIAYRTGKGAMGSMICATGGNHRVPYGAGDPSPDYYNDRRTNVWGWGSS